MTMPDALASCFLRQPVLRRIRGRLLERPKPTFSKRDLVGLGRIGRDNSGIWGAATAALLHFADGSTGCIDRLVLRVGSVLLRGTAYGAVGAKDATVALLGPQYSPTVAAGVANLTRISGHGFSALRAALWAVHD